MRTMIIIYWTPHLDGKYIGLEVEDVLTKTIVIILLLYDKSVYSCDLGNFWDLNQYLTTAWPQPMNTENS